MEKPWEKYPHCQICQNQGVTQNHPPPEVQQIAILMVGLGAFGDERNCMFYIAGLKLVRG